MQSRAEITQQHATTDLVHTRSSSTQQQRLFPEADSSICTKLLLCYIPWHLPAIERCLHQGMPWQPLQPLTHRLCRPQLWQLLTFSACHVQSVAVTWQHCSNSNKCQTLQDIMLSRNLYDLLLPS